MGNFYLATGIRDIKRYSHYTSILSPDQSKPVKSNHNQGINTRRLSNCTAAKAYKFTSSSLLLPLHPKYWFLKISTGTPPANTNPQLGSTWYHSSVDTTLEMFGTLPVYAFSLWIGFGVGTGLLWTVLPVSARPNKAVQHFNASLICLLGALLGGRGGTVLLNWSYYQTAPIEIPQVWLGGLSWEGALAGGLIALPLAARYLRTSPTQLADALLPLLACVTTSAWLASWMTGYAYGPETDAWWGLPVRDEWGELARRWPIQLAAAVTTLGIHALIQRLRTKRSLQEPGLAASLELGGIAAIILIVSSFQASVLPIWRDLPITSWFAAGTLALTMGLASAILLRKRVSHPKISGAHEN
jgi:prolipoprotein diacylglyceryltransferase